MRDYQSCTSCIYLQPSGPNVSTWVDDQRVNYWCDTQRLHPAIHAGCANHLTREEAMDLLEMGEAVPSPKERRASEEYRRHRRPHPSIP